MEAVVLTLLLACIPRLTDISSLFPTGLLEQAPWLSQPAV